MKISLMVVVQMFLKSQAALANCDSWKLMVPATVLCRAYIRGAAVIVEDEDEACFEKDSSLLFSDDVNA